VQFIHEQVQSDALVEEFVDGREIYVGVLGNARLTALPPWEMDFGALSRAETRIATRRRHELYGAHQTHRAARHELHARVANVRIGRCARCRQPP
jgi:hypothetical protein